MLIKFDQDYLRDLYTQGKCSDKKHRFQPQIIESYKKKVDFLRSSKQETDLWTINALNYEKLSGDKAGVSSIRINNQYRLEFTIDTTYDETIVTICTILDISNHYR